MQIMKSNELDCIDTSNGKILYKKSETKKPLNKKSLEQILKNIIWTRRKMRKKFVTLFWKIEKLKVNESIKLKENKMIKYFKNKHIY